MIYRRKDLRGGLLDRSGVTAVFDRSDAGARSSEKPSSEKPSGTPGGRGGVRIVAGDCETRGGDGRGTGGGIAAEASGAARATGDGGAMASGAARAAGDGGAVSAGSRPLNASRLANLAA